MDEVEIEKGEKLPNNDDDEACHPRPVFECGSGGDFDVADSVTVVTEQPEKVIQAYNQTQAD